MTSEAKLEANRRNAKKSTGPRTDAGKALARYNAVRHGVLTAAPLLPGEDAAAWDRHNAGVAASLAPAGALEEALAGRVALTLWRLGRFARAEALSTAADIAEVVLPKPPSDMDSIMPRVDRTLSAIEGAGKRVAELKVDWREALRAARSLERLPAAADGDPVRGAAAVVRAVRGTAGTCERKGARPPRDPRELAGLADGEPWTAGRLRHAIAVLAAGVGGEPGWLAGATLAALRRRARALAAEWEDARARFAGLAERVRTAPARRAAAAMLPRADRGDLMIRYESHLQKLLTTTLHELERLQALRVGRAVVPPIAVDVTVTGPALTAGD